MTPDVPCETLHLTSSFRWTSPQPQVSRKLQLQLQNDAVTLRLLAMEILEHNWSNHGYVRVLRDLDTHKITHCYMCSAVKHKPSSFNSMYGFLYTNASLSPMTTSRVTFKFAYFINSKCSHKQIITAALGFLLFPV